MPLLACDTVDRDTLLLDLESYLSWWALAGKRPLACAVTAEEWEALGGLPGDDAPPLRVFGMDLFVDPNAEDFRQGIKPGALTF